MFTTLRQPDVLVVTLAAAGILAITMGARQSLGLFIGPLNTSTGLGIATISLALAVGQFSWGAVQPIAGAAADRYGPRAVLIAIYLLLPRTELSFYLFAAGLGFTWLATVPPTAAIVGKLFGISYLGTLFGLTLLSHQVGGFRGAWLGGLALTRFGDFGWMWYADMALAVMAAIANLPIREAPVSRALAPA